MRQLRSRRRLASKSERLPEPVRWKLFVRTQRRSARYLRPGDVVTSRIRTPDGRIDLGEQRNVVM